MFAVYSHFYPQRQETTDLFSVSVVLRSLEMLSKWNHTAHNLGVWLPSPSTFLGMVHAAASISSSLFLIAKKRSTVGIQQVLFTHFSVDGLLLAFGWCE